MVEKLNNSEELIRRGLLIVEDFYVNDLGSRHKDRMVSTFIDKKINGTENRGYNTLYENVEYNHAVSNLFNDVVHQHFDVKDTQRPIKAWIYCQNKEHYKLIWHDHIKTCSINATTYIDTKEGEGSTELSYLHKRYEIIPEKNKIYIWPGWMAHRPLPPNTDDWRVCVNLEYYTLQRPILRSGGVVW